LIKSSDGFSEEGSYRDEVNIGGGISSKRDGVADDHLFED
jgi:hypothetical protein